MSVEKPRPISPEEVASEKLANIPAEVIETINQLIAQNYQSGSSIVRQRDIVTMLVLNGFDESQIYQNGWLNIENIYRKAGWKVDYDKPGYNESYEATFTFSKRKSKKV